MSEYGSVTQCPHCNTSFHVGPIQLEAANGSVRCGGCLKVFDALEHFIVEQKPLFGSEAKDAETENEAEAEQEFYNPRADDDEDILAFDQDSTEDQDNETDTYSDSDMENVEASQLEDELAQNEMESIHGEYEDADEESSAENSEDIEAAFDEDKAEAPDEDTAEALDEDKAKAPDEDVEDGIEEELSEELNEEFTESDVTSENEDQDQDISDILEESLAELEDNLADSSREDNSDTEGESESTWESVVAVRPGSEEEPLLSDLANPEDEEEKLAEQLFVGSKNRAAYKKISTPWTLCISFLFIALLAQSLYWQPASLREIDFYNRVSINYCALLPCRELILQDLSQLYVTGIVRPSTEYNNSLAVQVELRNRAELSQRFPHIELAFTDLRGEKISLRRFSPQEYLRAETAGRTLLQPFQRIQIELELYDPGASAISYEFNLLYLN